LTQESPSDCLFCTIQQQEADENNWIVHRGKHFYIVINAYPYSTGHVMVVCNRHIEHFSDLSAEENTEMTALVARCERAILTDYKPDGINIGANLGRSAGAGIVGHLHVHLVPRWHGDTNFMTTVGETRVISEDLGETFTRMKGHFE
jgi:ATP adenylyltransferase